MSVYYVYVVHGVVCGTCAPKWMCLVMLYVGIYMWLNVCVIVCAAVRTQGNRESDLCRCTSPALTKSVAIACMPTQDVCVDTNW